MRMGVLKSFMLAAGVVVIVLIVGCEEQQQQPDTKMARVMAAENIQLKKDLEERDSEIKKLKEQYGKESKEQEQLLAECQKSVEDLQEQLAGKFESQTNEFFEALTGDIGNLREENDNLKAQIETLKAKLEDAEAPK